MAASVPGLSRKNQSFPSYFVARRTLLLLDFFVFVVGTYFADRVEYSFDYSRADVGSYKYIFIASVLLESSAAGDSSMVEPPVGYQSTTGQQGDTNIYVAYKDYQMYPLYLLQLQ